MEPSSAIALPLAHPLAGALESHQNDTGLLTVKVPPAFYHFVLSQGIVRAVYIGAEQVFQRLLVVKLLQDLFLLPTEALSYQFESLPFQDLPGEAVPMNLQSLLLSVQTGLYQQKDVRGHVAVSSPASQPNSSSTAASPSFASPAEQARLITERVPLPEPHALYQHSGIDATKLGGEAYALWQQLEQELRGGQAISAQQLAARLSIGVGQARIKVYRLVLLGLLIPAPA